MFLLLMIVTVCATRSERLSKRRKYRGDVAARACARCRG